MEIEVSVEDAGPMGAELWLAVYEDKPRQCPGLGGWKWSPQRERFFTRVKGELATKLLREAEYVTPSGWLTLTLEGDQITSIRGI